MNLILCAAVLAVVMAGCSQPEKKSLNKWQPVMEKAPPGFFAVDTSAVGDDGYVPETNTFWGVGKEKPVQEKVRYRPESSFGVALEFLWFKAIQDGIKYAHYDPTAPTFTPKSTPLEQHFDYAPGSRVSANYILPTCEQQEIRANWMYYHSKPDELQRDTDDFSIFAGLALPTIGITQNQMCKHVEGEWELTLNAFELDVKVPLHLSKRFMLSPSGGVKLGFVDQDIDVHYGNFASSVTQDQNFVAAANTPTHIHAESDMWGLGPLIGLEGKILIPGEFGLFFSGGFAALAGRYSLDTKYEDFLQAPPGSRLTVRNHEWRVSLVEQVKVGLDKKWHFRTCRFNNMVLEVALGWEVQVWTNQWKPNLFDNFVRPANGEDLTLYGPFAKVGLNF